MIKFDIYKYANQLFTEILLSNYRAITLATMTGTQAPAVGTSVEWHRSDGSTIAIWRLPSTSRAYPLAPEKKAEVYRRFFEAEGLI